MPHGVLHASQEWICDSFLFFLAFIYYLVGHHLHLSRPCWEHFHSHPLRRVPKKTKPNIIYGYCGGRKSVMANSDRHHLRFYDFLFSFLVQRVFVILVFFFRYQVLLRSSQTHNEWIASQKEEEKKKKQIKYAVISENVRVKLLLMVRLSFVASLDKQIYCSSSIRPIQKASNMYICLEPARIYVALVVESFRQP